MFAIITQLVVVEFPERTSDCPEAKTFKDFSHKKKNTSQYPWWEEMIRDSPGLKDSALSWRIAVRFFDSGEICQLRMHTVTCLASHNLGKQQRTSNEPQNLIKINGHELSPGYTERVTIILRLRKWNIFLYRCLYFFVLTTIWNLSYKVYNSFGICKTVSWHAVINGPSLGDLWCNECSREEIS